MRSLLSDPGIGKGSRLGFKVVWEGGDEDDEVFDTYEEAEAAALEGQNSYAVGGEVLHLSNPGDYSEPDDSDEYEYEIVEVND